MLPHRQLGGVGIFSQQSFQDLIVVVAPVIDRTQVDMLMQLFPVGVMHALGPHLFHDRRQRAVLRRQRHLDMKLQVPLGVAETFLVTRFLLNLHQLHDVLFGHLSRREFSNIAFN